MLGFGVRIRAFIGSIFTTTIATTTRLVRRSLFGRSDRSAGHIGTAVGRRLAIREDALVFVALGLFDRFVKVVEPFGLLVLGSVNVSQDYKIPTQIRYLKETEHSLCGN